MKFLFKALGAVAVLMALQIAPANANIINYSATLTGANETTPNNSPATGSIFVTLDDVLNTLVVHETFSNLTLNPSGAHIHCCAAQGFNAGVVVNFIGAAAFPQNATSGVYDHTFNLTTDLIGISIANFISGLNSGLAYANIHTPGPFAGGEIRGQLTRVPEPASLALFGLGAGLLGFVRRRRTH